ncbi:PP-loop family-domain-containing protein [Trametes polyzona]|nr:PP-loop family-domain-containing protein [Trametes polyzona]
MPGFIPPITPAEFFHHLQRCIPPGGWHSRIVVANSGGPDSVALLYLLASVVRQQNELQHSLDDPPLDSNLPSRYGFPQVVGSAHVNHNMQDAAGHMEVKATQAAKWLSVSHIVERVPWGAGPFPPLDKVDERIAREARYNRIFRAMQRFKTNVVAFAHHGDDQVETAIMRMSHGSGTRGIAAMRPVRRWGMGNRDNVIDTFGLSGMRHWIVRPLLNVSKDRLLATCEANKLDYVNDPTNFQPDMTFRNAIRDALSGKGPTVLQTTGSSPSSCKTVNVQSYIDELRATVPDVRPADQLREAVRRYGLRMEEVDTRVTNILDNSRLQSPPSTLLLRSTGLEEAATEEVRFALIRRCLRYVSHGPWGSIWSEAGGDHRIYARISNNLWPSEPLPPPQDIDPQTGFPKDPRRTFTAGAGVVVYPVTINTHRGTIVSRGPDPANRNEEPGWIFARAPPHEKAQSGNPEMHAVLDVTEELLAPRGPVHTVLYDHRFAVHFDVARTLGAFSREELAAGKARVRIEPDTKWVLPKVVLSTEEEGTRREARFRWFLPHWKGAHRKPLVGRPFVKMQFVRKLDAI